MDSDDERRRLHRNLPIPTYEEAISRPTSSQRSRGPAEVSDDAERQGFLHGSRNTNYRRPMVESARTSLESDGSGDLSILDMVDDEHHERRHLEELDYMEPGESEAADRRQARLYHRARLRNKFSQHLSNLSATLSALRLPSFRALYTPVATDSDTTTPPSTSTGSWHARVRERMMLPDHYRISAPTFARLCALFTIAAVIWLLFAMDLFPSAMRHRNMMATLFDPESVRQYVQEHIDGPSIQGYAYHMASYGHVAGSEGDYYLARWMQERWEEEGNLDDEALLSYFVFANYPTNDGRHITTTVPDGRHWTAKLEEDMVDPAQPDREQTLVWHGYSMSGTVKGPLIFANGGSRHDFRALHEHNINTNGTIALVRMSPDHAPQSPALKVQFASEAGCIGVLIYNGGAEAVSANNRATEGGTPGMEVSPDDSVPRSNVALANWILGDPLSPGWASKEGALRAAREDNIALPAIPSLPISWADARVLLQQLDGQGVRVPADWISGGVFSGNGTGEHEEQSNNNTVVELKNENDETVSQRIWNLHGLIEGVEAPAEKVIIGAPRDSWCFGATSSASSSAILLEVVSIFGDLRKSGWRPLRTLEVSSWDGSMWSSAGSTEYVEDNIDYLRSNAIAYVDVGAGLSGSNLFAAGSPLLQRSLQHALGRVIGPGSNVTLREQFDSESTPEPISPLSQIGAEGDGAPFTHIAGIPSLTVGFRSPENEWVRGSCYNTFQYLDSIGATVDNMGYHTALAQVWVLVALDLLSSPILPLDVRTYAAAIEEWVKALQQEVEALFASRNMSGTLKDAGFDIEPLVSATTSLKNDAAAFHKFEDEWVTHVLAQGSVEDHHYGQRRHSWNERVIAFEKSLLDLPAGDSSNATEHGLKDRPQYKHSLFAPEKWADGVQFFPAVWESIEEGDWQGAGHQARRIADIIVRAGQALIEE